LTLDREELEEFLREKGVKSLDDFNAFMREERFHFSAWGRVSKFAGMKVDKRKSSPAAADFLHHLKIKFMFRIKAVQIDGDSEFMDQFEEACRRVKIQLFLNPPRHPEMNGGVERSNRTHREEFYFTKSRTSRSMSESITVSRRSTNIVITISGPTGPWTCRLRMNIISSGRELRKRKCHGCSNPIHRLT
jgi:hypothetical protein